MKRIKGVSDRVLWTLLFLSMSLAAIYKLYVAYLDKTFPETVIESRFEEIRNAYGIKIVYKIDENFFSDLVNPIIPAGPPSDSKISPIRHRVLLRYPQLLQAAFQKYPTPVVKRHLNAIYFADEIDENGFKYGGSYDPFRKIVYLVDNGWQRDEHAIYNFHHEFSSLLLSKKSMLLNPWIDQNPDGFIYFYEKDSGREEKTSLNGTEGEYKKGFMNTYGQTNFENDFNEYSAMIFTYPEKFKRIMDRHPRVRGKFSVWLKFYQEVDPIFTEEYLFGRK